MNTMQNDFFYLGVVTKTFGYKGEVVVYMDTDEPEKYTQLDAVFLKDDDEYLPYMINEITYKGANQFIVRFEEVDEPEAKRLIKSELYLPMSFLPPLTGNCFYYHEIIGFQVIDKEKGNIGFCVDFIEATRQPIMQIDCNGIEILIPAVDDFFDVIDRDKKTITINAPDGLIDIYLGNA